MSLRRRLVAISMISSKQRLWFGWTSSFHHESICSSKALVSHDACT